MHACRGQSTSTWDGCTGLGWEEAVAGSRARRGSDENGLARGKAHRAVAGPEARRRRPTSSSLAQSSTPFPHLPGTPPNPRRASLPCPPCGLAILRPAWYLYLHTRPVLVSGSESHRRPTGDFSWYRYVQVTEYGRRGGRGGRPVSGIAVRGTAVQRAGAPVTVTHSLSDERANAGGHVPEMNLCPLCPSLRQTSVRHYVRPRAPEARGHLAQSRAARSSPEHRWRRRSSQPQ